MLPERLRDAVHEFRVLPPETNPGNPFWHLREEASTFRILVSIFQRVDPEVVVTRLSPSTLSPAPLSKAFDVPHVLLVRGWVNSHNHYEEKRFSGFIEQVVRMNVRLSTEVFVAFEELREWVSEYRKEKQSPVEVLPNAVDPDVFRSMPKQEARRQLGIDEDAFIVGFVGSLSKRHELPTLLRAASCLDKTELIIVGDGEFRSVLEKIAAELSITDRVLFEGRIDHEKVPEYIAAFDVGYGVVSEKKPSNPIKCYEYLACGRPVVSSRSPEMAFIEEIDAGYLVNGIEREAVAEVIRRFRSKEENARKSMGERGREYVTEHATWQRLGEQLLSSVSERG